MHMMSDGNNRVRSSALKILTASLNPVKRLPRSDANVFSEYILPIITSVSGFPTTTSTNPFERSSKCSFCRVSVSAGRERSSALYVSTARGWISRNCAQVSRAFALASWGERDNSHGRDSRRRNQLVQYQRIWEWAASIAGKGFRDTK